MKDLLFSSDPTWPVWLAGGIAFCVLLVAGCRTIGGGWTFTLSVLAGIACEVIAFTVTRGRARADLQAISLPLLSPLLFVLVFGRRRPE